MVRGERTAMVRWARIAAIVGIGLLGPLLGAVPFFLTMAIASLGDARHGIVDWLVNPAIVSVLGAYVLGGVPAILSSLAVGIFVWWRGTIGAIQTSVIAAIAGLIGPFIIGGSGSLGVALFVCPISSVVALFAYAVAKRLNLLPVQPRS